MSLSREEAQEHGLLFYSDEAVYPGADPDQPHFFADLTIDGHTEHLAGKSEEDVLAAAERLLRSRGRLGGEQNAVLSQRSVADSDVHDARNENDDPVPPDSED